MLQYIITGTLIIAMFLLYCFVNRQGIISKIFGKVLTRDKRDARLKPYLEHFRDNRESKSGRSIIAQAAPWLGVLALVFLLGNQYVYFGTVISGSMEPLFKRGDLVLMHTFDKEPRIGDIIMYRVEELEEPVTHRVVSIESGGDVRTKGDANQETDKWLINKKYIMGKAVITGGQPVIVKGIGKKLVPEAGEFTIMTKMSKNLQTYFLFEQFRALQPFIIFFATIFYFFILIETRMENNRRFNGNGRKVIRNRTKDQ